MKCSQIPRAIFSFGQWGDFLSTGSWHSIHFNSAVHRTGGTALHLSACSSSLMPPTWMSFNWFFQNSDKMDVNYFVGIVATALSFCGILPHCYNATVATLRLQGVADDIYNSMWYKMPSKFKKLYILSIAVAQRPRYFTAFGIVQCSLETFKKVLVRCLLSINPFH